MKCMVIIKANDNSEAGVMPSQQMLTEMGAYNEELMNAGILLDGEGLHPTAKGVRIHFGKDGLETVHGPFHDSDMISGYWMWQVRDMAEAVAWARRIPNPDGENFNVELRPAFEAEDFGEEFTAELQAQEAKLRERLQQQQTQQQ